MAWSTIRKATDSDIEQLTAAAVRFCKRHSILCESASQAIYEIESLIAVRDATNGYEIESKARRCRPLWNRIVRKTLGSQSAQGISYGYIGFHVD